MAVAIKPLLQVAVQAQPATADWSGVTSRYVVPNRTTTTISSIVALNVSATPTATGDGLNILVTENLSDLTSVSNANILWSDLAIGNKETKLISPGITLDDGNTLVFSHGTATGTGTSLVVNMFGIETSE